MKRFHCPKCGVWSGDMQVTTEQGPGSAESSWAKEMGIHKEILRCPCGAVHNWDTLVGQDGAVALDILGRRLTPQELQRLNHEGTLDGSWARTTGDYHFALTEQQADWLFKQVFQLHQEVTINGWPVCEVSRGIKRLQ